MRHDDLVRMINQIAQFFDPYPAAEAIAGIKEHLHKFWDPSMRRELIDARQQLAPRLHLLANSALNELAAESAT